MPEASKKHSIFSGIILLLLAGILGVGGVLLNSFIDFTEPEENCPEIFGSLSDQVVAKPSPIDQRERTLRFAFTVPRGELVKFLEIVGPRITELAARVKKVGRIDIAHDYIDVVKRVENGTSDIGAMSAVAYAKLRKQHKIKALLERSGEVSKRSYVIVRKDDPAASLADLKGMRIAYKARDSMSGYIFPREEFRKAGFDLETHFSTEILTGNFANSILGLFSREYDCAVVSNTYFDELDAGTREKIKILHQSPDVPGGVYIVSQDGDPKLFEELSVEFRKFGKDVDLKGEFGGFFQVKTTDPASYDFLEKVVDDGNQ